MNRSTQVMLADTVRGRLFILDAWAVVFVAAFVITFGPKVLPHTATASVTGALVFAAVYVAAVIWRVLSGQLRADRGGAQLRELAGLPGSNRGRMLGIWLPITVMLSIAPALLMFGTKFEPFLLTAVTASVILAVSGSALDRHNREATDRIRQLFDDSSGTARPLGHRDVHV